MIKNIIPAHIINFIEKFKETKQNDNRLYIEIEQDKINASKEIENIPEESIIIITME